MKDCKMLLKLYKFTHFIRFFNGDNIISFLFFLIVTKTFFSVCRASFE